MAWKIEMRGAIYLPEPGWLLDARFPSEKCFVSHAHFDHLGRHRQALCSEPTARLMEARLGHRPDVRAIPFECDFDLEKGFSARLYPAGHIFGSAQLWVEHKASSLLYTGDFKLRQGLSAEACATPHADTLVMETTYGLPQYTFPPSSEVMAQIVEFCRDTLADEEIPVLFGYSLGKSQEILSSLHGAGLPIMLHPQVLKMTRVYESLAQGFPPYLPFSLAHCHGHVVICPPQAAHSAWLRKIRPRRTAAISGWAVMPGAIHRFQCDAAFPLSDHAGFDDLLAMVSRVRPQRIYTVHGYAREFAALLREQGWDALALGEPNQLELRLSGDTSIATVPQARRPSLVTEKAERKLVESASDDFHHLALTAESIRSVPAKKQKVRFLVEWLAQLQGSALALAVNYLSGQPFPPGDPRLLQLGWAIIKRGLLQVAGISEAHYKSVYRQLADSGETAESLLQGKTRPARFSLDAADQLFDRLAKTRQPALKEEIFASALQILQPVEAKYLVKVITGDLRIGLKEGLIEEALAMAFAQLPEAIRNAHLLCGDLGKVALAARANQLESITLKPFLALPPMLANPEPDETSILRKLPAPVWVEDKFDGIRCQVHKVGSRVELFSRELKSMSGQFEELVREIRKVPHNFIADGELVAWQGDRALPFAELQKRLGRRGDDLFLGKEIPVHLLLFDLLQFENDVVVQQPLRARRQLLESMAWAGGIRLAPVKTIPDAEEMEREFTAARERGNEGLICKDPESPYRPGRRGYMWIKLKKVGATLDVVVVAAEYGHGKRRGLLSDYTFAVRDERDQSLKTVGKAYSGLTDEEIARLTEHFLENTVEEKGRLRLVLPDTVLEIGFDTIQPSRRHNSGFALRFPRILRIRSDKSPTEIDTLSTCRKLAETFALSAKTNPSAS